MGSLPEVKIPAFQFYPADWRKDPSVQALSFNDRGVWFEILCIMHESSERGKLLLNGKPMPVEVLSRLLGLDKQALSRSLAKIIEMGVAKKDETGVLYSKRMVRDEEIRQIRHAAGVKGGNPALLKQKVKPPGSKPANQTSEDEDEDEDLLLEGESEGKAEGPELIYAEYPRKVARKDAIAAIRKAMVTVGFTDLLAKTRAYAQAVAGKDAQYIPHPATWFNRESYNDDPAQWNPKTTAPVGRQPTISELKAQRDMIESQLNTLRNQHGSGPLAKPWTDDEKAKREDFKKRIADLNDRIVKGGI
jgi:hypothetical protein